MFDDTLLLNFMQGFYGYGQYSSDFWFVGMEEGGGTTAKEIGDRLDAWNRLGRPELADLRVFQRQIGGSRFFEGKRTLQTTWKMLSQVLLGMESRDPSQEDVRRFQSDLLATSEGRSCLMELLPLPSPGKDRWPHYPNQSALPYLKERTTYEKHVRPWRIDHLRRRIREHRPRAVVFYGFDDLPHWRAIAGVDLTKRSSSDLFSSQGGDRLFLVMKHPSAFGVTNEYFCGVGAVLEQLLAGR